ncbi:MAG: hypothetical protein J6J86_02265, partial [Lachnospiraceae bacterium]|nr:hypothetical protein [Lachnospiraceae bacterium]
MNEYKKVKMARELFENLLNRSEKLKEFEAIGTVEEFKTMKENGSFSGVELAQLAAMQMRLRDYQTIGSVEECRAAVERMKPRKVKKFKKIGEIFYQCGVCGRDVFVHEKYCA